MTTPAPRLDKEHRVCPKCGGIMARKSKTCRACCDQAGPSNHNWRGGISADNYHYKLLQMARYPERVAARRAVDLAIRKGKLTRQPCEVCGAPQAHAHHDDYSQPLLVRWLCRQHHTELHRVEVWDPNANTTTDAVLITEASGNRTVLPVERKD